MLESALGPGFDAGAVGGLQLHAGARDFITCLVCSDIATLLRS